MTTRLHRGDLPDLSRYRGSVAIDTETMGLDLRRDRLCVVQLSPGDGSADVVQIPPGISEAANLKPGTVVDVGCGPGHMMAAVAGLGIAVFGVDISDASIRKLAEKGTPEFSLGRKSDTATDLLSRERIVYAYMRSLRERI